MTNAELFIQHLDKITGRAEDIIRPIDSTHPDLRPIYVFIYKNWPEEGLMTGFTFGLSNAKHPDWKYGRPELMVSVESRDESWPLAIGFIAEQLRGNFPFCLGNILNFHEKISEESEQDAFLVFAPLYLTNDQKSVQLNDFKCNITGMYPLYSEEIKLYDQIGLEAFWNLDGWDPLDVHRPRMTLRDLHK